MTKRPFFLVLTARRHTAVPCSLSPSEEEEAREGRRGRSAASEDYLARPESAEPARPECRKKRGAEAVGNRRREREVSISGRGIRPSNSRPPHFFRGCGGGIDASSKFDLYLPIPSVTG